MDGESECGTESNGEEEQSLSCRRAMRSFHFFPFLFLGVLNNCIFIILISAAKGISEGGAALVYLSNSFQLLFLKLTCPYWFQYVSYKSRCIIISVLFSSSLSIVALSSFLPLRLIGILFSSVAGGMGEPTILALSVVFLRKSRSNTNYFLTAFSAGTGIAGMFGYIWTLFMTTFLGFSPTTSLLCANIIPLLLFANYSLFIHDNNNLYSPVNEQYAALDRPDDARDVTETEKRISFAEKRRATLYLIKYMFPLFLVYAAEYTLQAGTWAAIGFPLHSVQARNEFYLYSNFAYQIGVFFCRSSALLIPLSLRTVTVLPVIQLAILFLFTFVARYQPPLLYDFDLLVFLSFVSGLIGGAVYVNGFNLISKDTNIREELRSFSISAATVADTVGIITADILGVVVQGCLYGANEIPETPTFECGYNFTKFET